MLPKVCVKTFNSTQMVSIACFLKRSHFSLSSLFLRSSPARSNPSISPRNQSKLPGRWCWRCSARSHRDWLLQWPAGVRAHLPAAPGGAVPHKPLRGPIQSGTDAGFCRWSPCHGHWQHLWAGCPAPVQHHWVGQKHPILPWTASLRAGQSNPLPRHSLLLLFKAIFKWMIPFKVQKSPLTNKLTIPNNLLYKIPPAFKKPKIGTHSDLFFDPTGGTAEAELERAVHLERCSVCFAYTHGSSAGGGWVSLIAHVCWAGRVLHGPGQGLPGPGGQTEPAAGGHSRVQLP